MSWQNFEDLSEENRIKAVQKELDYLEAEGVVVRMGDKYRMKTPKEIKKEIYDILNS